MVELLNLVLVDLVGDIILVILGLQEKDYSNKKEIMPTAVQVTSPKRIFYLKFLFVNLLTL